MCRGVPEAVVVLSILERDADGVAKRLAQGPAGCDLVEIRADLLRPDEVAGTLRRAPCPTIVTARRPEDGGRFEGSEEERGRIFDAALANGAADNDVELGGAHQARADGPDAGRVILSHHGAACDLAVLRSLDRAMASTRAARLKIVPRAERAAEVLAVADLLRGGDRPSRGRLAAFASGDAGAVSRILALSWGSWGTYAAPAASRATAEGQIPARDLLNLYDVRRIGPGTRRFALVGQPVSTSPSPAMHASGFRDAGMSACFLPIDAARVEDASPLLGRDRPLGIEAWGVTIPLKEALAGEVEPCDDVARLSGAVNTVLDDGRGRRGYNTDGSAAIDLARKTIDPRGARVAVLGTGGAAKGIAAAFVSAGAEVVLFGRSRSRREEAARRLGVEARPWEDAAARSWDILVNATPLGRRGEEAFPGDRVRGALVIDVAYGVETTPLVEAARARGVCVVDGFDLLVAQACRQFGLMTGRSANEASLRAAGAEWLQRRRLDAPRIAE